MTATFWLVVPMAAAGAAAGPAMSRLVEGSTRRLLAARGEAGHPLPAARLRRQAVALSGLTAALEGLAAARLGATWSLVPFAVFLAGLVALAWCDGRHLLLPKAIQHPTTLASGALLVLAAAATHDWHRLLVALACGAAGFAVFLAVNLLSPRALAFGDVRLAGAIGLVVGWFGVGRVVDAFVLASLSAAVVGLALLAARRIGLRSSLPYGVFLAIGAVVAVIW